VSKGEKRGMDILKLRNICFFKDGKEIRHSKLRLEFVDCVLITFEWQKNDEIMNTVIQVASEDTIFCLVCQWEALVKMIRGYPGESDDTPVSAV